MNQIVDVISSVRCAAPVITHGLKLLGNGSMGKGIVSLYVNGTIVGFSIGVSTVLIPLAVKKICNLIQENVENDLHEEANPV